MKKEDLSDEYKEFHKRFLSILDIEGDKYWTDKLSAQANLVWGWKKGRVPTIQYLLKICIISGVSPTWLFFGIGHQFLNSETSIHQIIPDKNREILQKKLFEYEKEINKIKEDAIYEINNLKQRSEIAKLLMWLLSETNKDEIEKVTPADIVSIVINPALNFLMEHGTTVTGLLKKYIETDKGKFLIERLINGISEIKGRKIE